VTDTNSGSKGNLLPAYLLMLAAVLGVVATSILTQHHFVGGDLWGCPKNAIFDCDAVNRSQFSEFRGIPLSIIGFITYLFVFGLGMTRVVKGPVRGAGSMAYAFLIGLFATAFSVYLFWLSKTVLHKLCLWCVVTYGVNLATFVFSAWALGGPSKLIPAIKNDWDNLGAKKTLAYPLLAVIVIGFGFAFFSPGPLFNGPEEGSSGPLSAKVDVRAATLASPYKNPSAGGGYSKGADKPVLEIIEFADLECPACRRAFWPLSDFVKKHPKEVRLVFRHYPLDQKCNASMRRVLHEYACDTAMAAESAGLQGKFWEYVESVYRMKDEQGVQITKPDLRQPALLDRARAIGLDMTQFEEGLKSEALMDKLISDLADGDAFGVESTPTIYVNGRLVKNFGPLDQRALETWLEMAKNGELDPPKSSSMIAP
jgi:protein-disulfide isomerase/uncharacterized membrane protein